MFFLRQPFWLTATSNRSNPAPAYHRHGAPRCRRSILQQRRNGVSAGHVVCPLLYEIPPHQIDLADMVAGTDVQNHLDRVNQPVNLSVHAKYFDMVQPFNIFCIRTTYTSNMSITLNSRLKKSLRIGRHDNAWRGSISPIQCTDFIYISSYVLGFPHEFNNILLPPFICTTSSTRACHD